MGVVTLEIADLASLIVLFSTSFILSLGAGKKYKGHTEGCYWPSGMATTCTCSTM